MVAVLICRLFLACYLIVFVVVEWWIFVLGVTLVVMSHLAWIRRWRLLLIVIAFYWVWLSVIDRLRLSLVCKKLAIITLIVRIGIAGGVLVWIGISKEWKILFHAFLSATWSFCIYLTIRDSSSACIVSLYTRNTSIN